MANKEEPSIYKSVPKELVNLTPEQVLPRGLPTKALSAPKSRLRHKGLDV